MNAASGLTLLISVLGVAGMLLAALFYVRGEVHVPGKPVLLALRLSILAIVTLLLLDVRLPGEDPTGRAVGEGVRWVLLDPDLSLLVPSEEGGSLWEVAVDRAGAEVEGGAHLALATPGTAGPEGMELAGLVRRAPSHPSGDLVQGVARLAEAGAESVVVLSSFRRPPGFLEMLARETPIPVRLAPLVEGGTRNAGIAELTLPAVATAAQPVTGRISIFGEGGSPGDTVRIELRTNGALVETIRLPLPGPGAEASAPVRLPPAPDTGVVRVSAHALLEGDVFPPDDELARWVRIGEPEGGILLVSLEPGWEPRYLLPVLEAVTGLDGEGYLALGEDRFLPLGEGSEDLQIVGPEGFRNRMRRSALLVLHGVGRRTPDWLAKEAEGHPAVVYFPVDPEGATLAGVSRGSTPGGSATEGEWGLDPQLPASAVAPFLSGIRLATLPPLTLVIEAEETGGVQVVLRGQAVRGGRVAPLLLLREAEGEGRRAIALADGFWRWGSRDGEPREAYRALWGGVSNWLLAPSDPLIEEGVRPVAQVQPRGVPLKWEVAPGVERAELSLVPIRLGDGQLGDGQLENGALPTDGEGSSGATAFRGILKPEEGGIASTPAVDPGLYRFEVRDPAAGLNGPPMTAGLVEVEAWAPSLRYPPLAVPERLEPSANAGGGGEAGGGRPLRTHPLPYVVALALLCLEWLGRRRVGLR
ncbi:MAG: hypothetical protein EXR92_04315 [Gemmatimonadetes bacterium]|nr:hypothetical protein [Gemmatimonadota bacterium]